MKTSQMLINFLFPSVCCFCGEITAYDRAVCAHCRKTVLPISGITCSACGMERGFCSCAEQPTEYERCVASFYYEELPKQGILLLKYGETPYIARYLSAYMAKQFVARLQGIRFDMVIAVPMHRLKRRARGYNQAEMIARPLARRLGISYTKNILIQFRKNQSQHLQHRDVRTKNVAGIYRLGKGASIKGKTILLVDDILTTGATLRECARVLKAGGAKAVYCVVFCATKPINA